MTHPRASTRKEAAIYLGLLGVLLLVWAGMDGPAALLAAVVGIAGGWYAGRRL